MIGRTLLHYRVLEKLGEGGMGAVYRTRGEFPRFLEQPLADLLARLGIAAANRA